jgi:hypothetical protein
MSSIDKWFTFLAFVAFACFAAVITLQIMEMMFYNGSGAYEELSSVWNPPKWL